MTSQASAAASLIRFAVVGLGSAGTGRVRVLSTEQSKSAGFELKAVVSRRPPPEDIAHLAKPLDEVIKDEEIDAAVVCTENLTHEDFAAQLLSAGKHVIIEYPAALSDKGTRRLFQIAEDKGVTLHVENISLLTSTADDLKARLQSMGKLIEGSMHMSRGYKSPQSNGFFSFQGISRLWTLVDIFGELKLVDATLKEIEPQHVIMQAAFEPKDTAGVYLLWEEEQGVPRFKRRVYFKMEKGEIDSLPPPMGREGKSLWLLDFESFAAKVRGDVSVEEIERQKEVVLHIHQLSEEIENVCRSKGVVTAS